jgi:FAD:protein FMN transferase
MLHVRFSVLLFQLLITVSVLTPEILSGQQLNRYEFISQHMGTEFQVVFYASDPAVAEEASEAVFNRIEELNEIMSDYLETSELNRLSQTSGTGNYIEVSKPLYDVINRSVQISDEANGRFDITVGPYSHIWRGINRMSEPQLPTPEELRRAGKSVGNQFIDINDDAKKIRLEKQNMILDLGGIAKGYATDEGLKILETFGITSAFVNGGGDISIGDPPPGQLGWNIAIPLMSADAPKFMELSLANRAISTSGDQYQFIEIDGTRFSHIIDPVTGLGITDRIQVTIISKNGMDADAYASALNVMDFKKAKTFVKSNHGIEACIQKEYKDDVMIWMSDGFYPFLKPEK